MGQSVQVGTRISCRVSFEHHLLKLFNTIEPFEFLNDLMCYINAYGAWFFKILISNYQIMTSLHAYIILRSFNYLPFKISSIPSSNLLSSIWYNVQYYSGSCKGKNIGQNLYVSSNAGAYPTLNVTSVITAWNNERNDWNFKTATCNTGKICGHWTAVNQEQ